MNTQVVVIGGGIVGAAVVYHLAQAGWTDIVIVDKGEFEVNDGSTSHAPGGVVSLGHSKILTQMGQYGSWLYASLHDYAPDRRMIKAFGGLELAISERRMRDLVRLHGEAYSFGAQGAELLTPQQTAERLPVLDPAAVVGALWVPRNMIVAGSHVALALLRDAGQRATVRRLAHTEVLDVEQHHGHITAVVTSTPEVGRIACEAAVLATNIWGPILGDKLGIPLPMLAYEHQYVYTEPLEALAAFDPGNKDHEHTWPTCRELDSAIYFRHHWNQLGIGSYWHAPRPVRAEQIGKSALRPFTPGDFERAWAQTQKLIPAARGARFGRSFNGMFAFPVDGLPMIGESAIKGLWTAVGSWLTHAAGVAKSLVEWMSMGETEWDMRGCNVHRFHGFQTTRAYYHTVCDKNYAEIYDVVHPRQPQSKPREVRVSPFYGRWRALDANFTTFAGLELPNWFESNARLLEKYDDQVPSRSGWAAEYWSRIQGAEHLETRHNVTVWDLHGLSILEVAGPQALAFVNHLCAAQMGRPVGSVIYTTWLTPRGGVRRDLAVARLAEDRFWMFVGEGTRPQDLAWVRGWAERYPTVSIHDISDAYTALGVYGPNARQVLSAVTADDVSNAGFPYMTARWIEIGMSRVFAMRVSYVGELGWELHLPTDQALIVFDALWEAGRAYDMAPAGMGALDSLRLEKGYRLWGGDVHTEYNAYESGLGWTVKLDKPDDFVGKSASAALKGQALKKKLVALTLEEPDAVALGYEPLFADARCVGYVTSANYAYSLGKFLLYGYVSADLAAPGSQVDVVYFGERRRATVLAEPVFDPRMEKLKR
jgi:glycine cleavage system aminomethyltransferase T/glycine/D-amino acid oxidase-like deaminating enzyme